MIFKLVDPLGNEVALTEECWVNHILVEHPIMKHFFYELKEVIVSPDFIFKSKISKKTFLYFKKFTKEGWGNFYLMSAVEKKPKKKKGFIKTSFPVYNLSKGGELIWKKF
jgi:hypothetical protein